MKQCLVTIFTLAVLSLQAQKNTLLNQAFWRNNPNLEAVKAAITEGSNPSEFNRNMFDPVVLAINNQASADVIKFLIDQKGNEPNKLTHDGRTYIFWAAARGNVEVVEYLISKGADVNIIDSHSATAMSFAASNGQQNTKVYDALIKAGSDVKQKNQEGASLLLQAIVSDKDFALTNYFILKGLTLQDVDAAGNTAFNYVAKTGNIDLMKTLVEKGVKYNNNAMILAAQGGRSGTTKLEVYQYLESLGIKPNAVNANGENALHALARKPNESPIISYFISKGADVNQADNEGNTPFMLAAGFNRDTATVALLATTVKNINQANKKGLTALALATRNNSAELMQYLITKGANVNAVDNDGNNLAYYWLLSYNPQAFGGKQEGGRPQEQAAPITDAFTAKMNVLQNNGFNIATPQKNGNTLYHLAINKSDLGLLKRIEQLKVDVNVKNKEGLTPLLKAAMVAKDDTILKYLLSIGAKKDSTTNFNETAYNLAKENEFLTKNNISVDFLK
ncbi:MAG: ankyrin repeat domain-containing protein [Flavobacterium sp.]|nr:ankyrin repeat domain-containing protein [Flavobacterium sp.]